MANDLEAVLDDARRNLRSFMEMDEPSGEDFRRAKAIQSIYASATRELQTRGAQEAVRYSVASEILSREEREQYVKLAMPDHQAVRIIANRKALKAS